MSTTHPVTGDERGQTTILMAGVIVVVFAIALGLALFGRAAVDRARARTAADAIALATVDDPVVAGDLESWYGDRGAAATSGGGQAWAGQGNAQAQAWAVSVADEVSAAPAVRAIVGRAAQVLGVPLVAVRIEGTDFWFDFEAAAAFETVAVEFGVCRIGEFAATVQFTLC